MPEGGALLDWAEMAERLAGLVATLEDHLAKAEREALHCAVALAEERGLDLYLVGGAVRDLHLGVAAVDIDLLTEGDAIALATALGDAMGARVVAHPRFGTAAVSGEGFRLDIAQARSERYPRPGALPVVEPATLEEDLARRDFTINAMALRLTGPRRGEVIDPHGGESDLKRRVVRVLYDASFQDDATRITRALRYGGRFRYEIEAHTAALLRRDVSYIDTISGARLRYEFERIANEARVAEIVRRAGDLGVLAAVYAALRAGDRELTALGDLPALRHSHRDAALFCVLLSRATVGDAEGAIERLRLTGRQAGAVRAFLRLRDNEAQLAEAGLRPSEAVALFEVAPRPAIEAFALLAGTTIVGERASRFLDEWRHIKPRLNGRDVEALGVPHGPRVGEALALLREARLDGRAPRREDEVALVRASLVDGRPLVGVRRG
jgi:tRNA nucleotidyltransferase (CCA-adding enzyme)